MRTDSAVAFASPRQLVYASRDAAQKSSPAGLPIDNSCFDDELFLPITWQDEELIRTPGIASKLALSPDEGDAAARSPNDC
mmetsp:Transcript_29185/g.63920  ORF Transcript_29185/g.63920 Transcript_29185/m.63920 type:complete len:81 (+) Transcript_29185:962-1204(+)|eukprot:5329956-Pleurochrysis_carterae.AAC.2